MKIIPNPLLLPGETRVVVAGQETPPYACAVAYIRDEEGLYYILFEDGYVELLGPADVAFGDDADSIEFHPSEM